jgi:hypothetical protein
MKANVNELGVAAMRENHGNSRVTDRPRGDGSHAAATNAVEKAPLPAASPGGTERE